MRSDHENQPVHASINLKILDTNKRSLHLPTTDIRITFPVSTRHTLIRSSSISIFNKQDRFTSQTKFISKKMHR